MSGTEIEWAGRLTCAEWVQGDDELLRTGRAAARAGQLSERAISLGVAFRPPETWVRHWEAEGIPVVRRRSGGSGLLHEVGDLLWSLVLPRPSAAPRLRFAEAYPELGGPIVRGLRTEGVEAAWEPPMCLSDRFCLFGRRGMVLSVGDRALGGAAQHLTHSALLHQGTVGSTVDRSLLAKMFDLPGELLGGRLGAVTELRKGARMEQVGKAFLHEVESGRSPTLAP